MSAHSTPASHIELTLTRQSADHHIAVTCNNQPSHTFDLHTLIPQQQQGPPQPPTDPVTYGKAIYTALFPPNTPAHHALANTPQRILLVTTDPDLDAIPWEYPYGTYGTEDFPSFLVLECPFLRSLPPDQRLAPPDLDSGLHIVAIPSDPLSNHLQPLNIDAEWTRLKEFIHSVPYAITLERTRPPTIEQTRHLLANQRNRIIHFMGHGGQHETGALLYFEKDNGDLETVTAKHFVQRVRGTVFLVLLNACVSATPGPTLFSNLAAALVRQQTPYALGMRFSIHDDDARTFSRSFYDNLASGTPLEEALFQARLTLASSQRPWVIGVPVLYTSLSAPVQGFTCIAGTPTIKEHQPRIEVSALTRAEGTFQGRINELKQLGTHLTGDTRPRLITIHGGGGQGKTALAREAVERFAHAWPGGVWATTLENLPSRATFVNDLARFLDIQELLDPNAVERQVLAQLSLRRTLIALDNAETLIDAVEANNAAAQELAQFIRQLPSPSVSLLVTSRIQLGWNGEVTHELGELSPKEGATLFRQSAPGRTDEIQLSLAEHLSEELEGHPFSLRLLGAAFNASAISLSAFIQEYEARLVQAENKYLHEGHRQRTLYASIETSVRYLSNDLRTLLSGLWLFHARFLAQTAVAIFDPQHEDSEENPSPIRDHLHILWQRGLLTRETITVRDGTLQFYHLLSTTRPYLLLTTQSYVEQHLKQAFEPKALLEHFGAHYAQLARFLYSEIGRSAAAVVTAQQAREDLDRAVTYVAGIQQGYYLLHWGRIVHRLGNPRHGLELTKRALALAQQGQDQHLELQALNNMAVVYQDTGQPQQALLLYDQALPITREVGDRAGEAATLNNMAVVYKDTGQPQQALTLYQQALPIMREVGDRAGEATTLNNMALVYKDTGQPQQALTLYQQALPIMREVGDRAGEATTLNNMGEVYRVTGQPQQALDLYDQALLITREVSDRAGEAATLNNMGEVYRVTGQPQQALLLYDQALSIRREVSDRAGEAATLNNMALVYNAMRQPQRALHLYDQALPIMREVSNRTGEAATLNNMAVVYKDTGQPQQALTLYQQALPIMREVGDRAGEATTLNNMGAVYRVTGQSQQALTLYQQALPIMREVGDRAGEAATLNNMAVVYKDTGQPQQALTLYQQALPIMREVGNRAGEVNTLSNMAVLLYQDLNHTEEAITHLEQAIAVLVNTGLPQDAAGHKREDLQQWLQMMRTGDSPGAQAGGHAIMPAEQLQQIIGNTVAVMTTVQDRRAEWHEAMVGALQKAQNINRPQEAELFSAVLDILDGRPPSLAPEHTYAKAVAAIQQGIAGGA